MRAAPAFRVRRSPGGLWLVEYRRYAYRGRPMWLTHCVADTHADAMYRAQRAAVQAWDRVLNR